MVVGQLDMFGNVVTEEQIKPKATGRRKYLTMQEMHGVIDGKTCKTCQHCKHVMAQKLATVQKLLLILSLGYTIKDGDIKGISALKAKRTVARYITNLSISKEEKIALAEKCGLTVKNGRIYAK